MFESTRVTDFILEKDPLFARVNLEPAEYALYDKVYEKMHVEAPAPDLVIYLQANPERLLERIGKRGIDAEQAISLIVNGYAKDVLNQLPMEFAVEAQKLLAISLEGSVG